MLKWNALGQLTQVATTRNGQSANTTYQYDGLGRRIRKETAGVVREYVYDGDHLVLEVDGQGHDLAEYVYYPGVDAPHSMRRRDAAGRWKTYYYLTEAPGHVVGLMDETGQYAYTPFGEITETTPEGVAPVENPLTYTAREWDAEVGLYFYRARYYDPVLQRFISEDPIGLAGGLNPYAYVGNDPVNSRDPSGTIEEGQCEALSRLIENGEDRAMFLAACRRLTGTPQVLPGITVTAEMPDPFAFMKRMMARSDQFMAEHASKIHESRITGGDMMLCLATGLASCAKAQGTRRATNRWLDRNEILGDPLRNTMRHRYGSCYLARNYGLRSALRITNAHEDYMFPSNANAASRLEDSATDVKNNMIGMAVGLSGAPCNSVLQF